MHIIKVVLTEFLYGAHLVSLGTLGIVLGTSLIFEVNPEVLILAIAYLIPQVIYRYNYVRELLFDLETNPERSKYFRSDSKWVRLSPIISLVVILILLSFTNLPTFLLVVLIVLSGILYTEYFKKLPIIGFKNYYTSFFWAISVIIVPVYYNIYNVSPYLYIVLFVFLREIINTIFFDLKDIESDKERGVRTVPVYLGKMKTINVLHVVNLLSVIPILIGVYNREIPVSALALSLTVFNGILFLSKGMNLSNKNLRYLSYILVDGECPMWPILILLAKLIT